MFFLALDFLLDLLSLGSPFFADFLRAFDRLEILILIYCCLHLLK